MNKYTFSKLFFCTSFVFIFFIIQIVPISSAKDYTYKDIFEIREDDEFFVFNLRFDSLDGRTELENNEFIFNDKLTNCYLTILEKNPNDFDIKPISINVTSPSKKNYSGIFEDFGVDYYLAQFPFSLENDSSIALNEIGLWWVTIKFNKSGSLMTWFFSDSDHKNFNENSTIKIFYGHSLNVLSNLEYQQLKTAKALEESAKASKDSIYWNKISTGALIGAAVIAFISILVQILLSNKKSNEEGRERERQEQTRVRKINADCKLKVSDGLLDLQLLAFYVEDFLKRIKSSNYQFSDSTLKEVENITKEFEKQVSKIRAGITYSLTFPEAKKISEKIGIISIKIVDFNVLWKKIVNQPTEEDIEKGIIEIRKIKKIITKFLSETAK